ncbi:MAG TPA: arginine repressor [Verrucomicrobiae bacterium]|jgi:transcriptional regulator of arginine metabolism|nr:arginine repressor [Verrucomicrobiae bacterium]
MNEHTDRRGVRRHETILALVRSGAVRSQGQLQRLLRRRGLAVAQPTLSRDLRDLGLAKTPRGYVAPESAAGRYSAPGRGEARLRRALRGFALSAQAAGSLVVVKTPPAAASPLARALDEAGLPDAAGALAGDDTIFIATRGARAARALARQLTAALAQRTLREGA